MVLFERRTTEREISTAIMQIAAEREDGYVTLNELREEIPKRINLTAGDKQPSQTRPGELLWEQLLRNVQSHHNSKGNFIHEGYLEHIKGGAYRITEKGREALGRYDLL
jgi:hypothetical protein